MRILYLYLSVLLIIAAGLVLTRKEPLDPSAKIDWYMRPFHRMARGCYRLLTKRRRKGAPERRRSLLSGSVRKDLETMTPFSFRETMEREYVLKKISFLLLFVFAASLMASLTTLAAQTSKGMDEEGRVERNGLGGTRKELLLEEENLGAFSLTVNAQQYGKEELEKMAEEVFLALETMIASENESLQAVRTPLFLPDQVEGYPFLITWESSKYELIDTGGRVYNARFEEGEKEEAVLEAHLRLDGQFFRKEFPITVLAPLKTPEEKLREAVTDAMTEAETRTAAEKEFALPVEVEGRTLKFHEVVRDRSFLLFGAMLLIGVLALVGMDYDLRRAVLARERRLQLEYPQVVSKFVLYLGAGMSVRNVFAKIAQSGGEKKDGKIHPAYEEVLYTVRELESGVTETEAYAHFGERCRERQYIKLSSILTQNLIRGNDNLLKALQEEAEISFENRKNLARKLGEEAGTKLLVPMVMMLAVTLVMIMIPAYLGFSV
ncbi:MAG: type II secretion system F family protein [Lachnospiraceae bacterium]|nr:type II secretion system F family protein [Lachnospiraceae bacterium]